MKNTNRISKRILIFGWGAAIILLLASAVIYFGAGKIFDYYPSMALCSSLLAFSRPVFVISSVSALAFEYMKKIKSKE